MKKEGKGEKARKDLRRVGKRVIFAGVGFGAVLLVVFFLLPVWISNEQGRTYVLQQLNKHMRARLEVEDWSLGWFRGTELKNVTVTLPDGSRLLSCPHVKSELSLWGILWGNYDVGTMTAETMQLNVTKNIDGTTSLDALRGENGDPGAYGILRSLRGSVQVGSAVVTVNSVRTGQSLTYTDVKAGLTIASPEAPFHVQVTAAAPERTLSLSATLPAVKYWPGDIIGEQTAALDGDFAATNLPTALVSDCLGTDVNWRDSMGENLELVTVSNHPAVGVEGTRPSVVVRGNNGVIRVRAWMWERGGRPLVTLRGNGDDGLSASVRVSDPLRKALCYLNPVFGQLREGDGVVRVEVSEMEYVPGEKLNGAGRVTFPGMTFARAGVMAELLGDGGAGEKVAVTATPLKVKFDGQQFGYENFTMDCGVGKGKIVFSGTTTVMGDYHLLATVPAPAGGGVLSSASADVPVTGTLEHPAIVRVR